MPPMVGSGYTFADFLQRLERSPVSHMSPLYHEHRLLFVNRPDMLSKAVLSISWERGLAMLRAAYYAQPVAAETYRALLARMLRHNRHVTCTGAGQLVSWQAAMSVMNEAVLAHGTSLPTRVSVSTLRLLAPHRQWRTALDVLKLNQANGQLTKPMLLDAAHACATPDSWQHALQLLMHLHKQDPPLLFDAIQSMRPPGTTALTAAASAHALLPSAREAGAPTPAQQHILSVLNSVVGSVPADVALRDPLCSSYLTHLLASTTLPPELRVQRATAAMAQLPWTSAVSLLGDLSEPTLLSDADWSRVRDTLALPDGEAAVKSGSPKRQKRRRLPAAKRRLKAKAAAVVASAESSAATDASAAGLEGSVADALNEEAEMGGHEEGDAEETASPPGASPAVRDDASVMPAVAETLFARLELVHTSPLTAAAMMAVMVEKLPTPAMAAAFLQSCATHLSQPAAAPAPEQEAATTVAGSLAATRHPVVVHALLRNCARHADGWATAVPVLLERSAAQVPTPAGLLSGLVQQLRHAKQVTLAVRLLHEHVIPSGSVLTPTAWEDMLECVLAHNRALRLRAEGTATPAAVPHVSGVHWVSALSWATTRQAVSSEDRIQQTGTGPSSGATSRRPLAVVPLERPLSPKALSLLVNICVLGGSPQGALHAIGYARRVDKTELPHTAHIRALLYCMQYGRPFEAEAIVEQYAKREGEAATLPLRHLLRLIGESATSRGAEASSRD